VAEKSLILGITGSRTEPKLAQLITLDNWFKSAYRQYDYVEVHHGDCIGADDFAHRMASRYGFQTCVHPPTNKAFVMNHKGSFGNYPDKPYLERNREIVACSTMVIALPNTFKEQQRGGTWHCARFAQASMKDVLIIWPDGKTKLWPSYHETDDIPFDKWLRT